MKIVHDLLFNISINFDILVSKLDNYLDKRKKSEVYIVYLMPILLVGYISLEVLLPMSEETLSHSKGNIEALENQINTYKSSLAAVRDGRTLVDILEEKNQQLKMRITKEVDKNYFIQSKIDAEFEAIKYNRENWSNYLFDVTELATQTKVGISSFSNRVNNEAKFDTFSKVMELDLNATGNFTGVMEFLDTLERDKRIAEITDLKMNGDEDITFSVHIDMWGVK